MGTIVSTLRETLAPWRDALCLVGAAYVAKVVITLTWRCVGVFRGYFLSRLHPADIGRFGGWAGEWTVHLSK